MPKTWIFAEITEGMCSRIDKVMVLDNFSLTSLQLHDL